MQNIATNSAPSSGLTPFSAHCRLVETGGPDASHSGGTHSVFYCQPLPQTTLLGARPQKMVSDRKLGPRSHHDGRRHPQAEGRNVR
jgi:hypothetical protein